MIFLILMNILFAGALPLIKVALRYGHPYVLVALRMLCAGLLLMAYGIWRGERMGWKCWRYLAEAGLLNFYALCMLEAYALEFIDASVASLLWAQLPIMTGCVMYLWRGERLPLRKWAALLVAAVSGVVLCGAPALCQAHVLGCVRDHMWAGLCMLGAVFCAAVGYVPLQAVVRRERQPVALSHGIMMLGAGVLSLATACIAMPSGIVQSTQWTPFLIYMGVISIGVNCGGLMVQGLLLRRSYTPTVLALSSLLTPLFGMLYGVGLLCEPWRPSYLLVMIGMASSFALWGLRDLGSINDSVEAE